MLRVVLLNAQVAPLQRACRTMLGDVPPAVWRSAGLTSGALAVRISARGAHRAVFWLIVLGADSAGPDAVRRAAVAAA